MSLADRPLGPVFELRFTTCGHRVHLGVVRGTAEQLDAARERAEDLLSRWAGPADDDSPETTLLESLAGRVELDRPLADRVHLLVPAVTADLLVQDLMDEGACGACARVDSDATFRGLPPRVDGWRVQVPDQRGGPGLLLVADGGVSTRGRGAARVTVTADRAWRAAAAAEQLLETQPTGAAAVSAMRSAPA